VLADLLEFYKTSAVNQISGFCHEAERLDVEDLSKAYRRLVKSAPSRHERRPSLDYFVGHSGEAPGGESSNRREELLAMALWNSARGRQPLALPGGEQLDLLDYQFPLKAQRSDKGIGKVDLFGLIEKEKPCVIELKIHREGKGKSDTPLRAFLEALAYCATVEANISAIAKEAHAKFGHVFAGKKPALMVMAPEAYWVDYVNHPMAGNWWPVLKHLADRVEKSLEVECYFVALRNADFTTGSSSAKPAITGTCSLTFVEDLVHESY